MEKQMIDLLKVKSVLHTKEFLQDKQFQLRVIKNVAIKKFA